MLLPDHGPLDMSRSTVTGVDGTVVDCTVVDFKVADSTVPVPRLPPRT